MTDCAIKLELKQAQKDAMRAKDMDRLKTLRGILAAIKDVEVNERIDLDDVRVLAVLDKMQKQRRDSINQFDAAGRDDLSEVEKRELEVIKQFLPTQLSKTDINQLIDQAISASGSSSIKEMGQIMGILKPQMQGRADMAEVSKLIKGKLS